MLDLSSLEVMIDVIKVCSLGDIHTLYLMRMWMSEPQFIFLLKQVVKAKRGKKSFYSEASTSASSSNKHIAIDIEKPEKDGRQIKESNDNARKRV